MQSSHTSLDDSVAKDEPTLHTHNNIALTEIPVARAASLLINEQNTRWMFFNG